MSSLLVNPWLLASIVGGVLLILLIAVVPENVANVVGQIFQLVGRLVNALAGEAEAGATALFSIVHGVFVVSGQPKKSSEEQKAPAPVTEAPAAKTAAGDPPAAKEGATQERAQPTASATATTSAASTQRVEEDAPFMWVAETIFVRLIYLATVIIVVGSDFVFAILRLQAVLFPSLPTPVHDLALLSLLTGGLFVAIVLLTGALTLDFLNVLPPPARLFPNLDDGKRRLLLVISVLSFVLSILTVGALFLQGQLLISLADTFPVGAIALATLIGVLQVLVVFLGAWGAIRGLAILLALLGGIVGLVLHLVAVLLRWVGDALDVVGTSILRDLIYGIATIFGHRHEQSPRATAISNVLSIVGYGDRSSSFTALLCEDVVHMYARAGLLAAGAYAEEPSVREDVRSRLARVGVNNISPLSTNGIEPLLTLQNQVIRAYHGKGASNKVLLWIVDGEKAAQCTATLAALKSELPDLSITVLCLLPPGGIRSREPFTQLTKLATQRVGKGDTAINTTIVVDDRSPLYRILGEPIADHLVARSLSGMLLAPLHNPANPSFVTVVRSLNEAGFAFAALATDSAGIVTAEGGSGSGAGTGRRSKGSGSVSPELALSRTEELTKRLLTGASASTVEQTPDSNQQALYVNFVVPIAARSPEFSKFRGLISNSLADDYGIYLYGVVDGEGVDLSESTLTSKGDRYTQVGVLYGIGDVERLQRASAPHNGQQVVDSH